jgi:membrane protein
MGFYWFLALFPSILAAVGFIGLVHASPELVSNISKAIKAALPGSASGVLTDALDKAASSPRGSSAVAALIGTALALWSASAGMVAVQTGLDVVYDVEEERKFVKKRAIAFLLILAAVVLGGVAAGLIVFGKPIGDGIREHLPFGGAEFILVWTVIRWVLGLLALSLLFAVFYYLGPNRESPKFGWVSPGGLVATAIWLLASIGFSFYVSSLGSYGKTYGSLTGVVVLMLWLYLSAIAVVLGGELNAELERQAERRRRQGGGGKEPAAKKQAARQQAAQPARPAAAPAREEPTQATAPPPAAAPSSYEADWLESMRRLRDGSAPPDRR